jgi:hypothetical protein
LKKKKREREEEEKNILMRYSRMLFFHEKAKAVKKLVRTEN